MSFRPSNRSHSRRGFTLLEVIVATVIFTTAAAAIGAVFSAGVRLWHRLQFEQTTESVYLAMSDIARRRQAARRFDPLDHNRVRTPNELVFAGSVINTDGRQDFGEIRYRVMPPGGILVRQERTYSEALTQGPGRMTVLAEQVVGLKTENLFMDPLRGEFQSEPVFGKAREGFEPEPEAVKVTIQFKTANGKSHELERVIPVASASLLEEIGHKKL